MQTLKINVIKAIGYVRVSTEDQANEGISLEAQAERIKNYCSAKGWELSGIVKDAGFSGKDTNRPGLQSILKQCKRRNGSVDSRSFDVVVVVKLDRLTRSVKDAGRLSEEFVSKEIELTTIDENIDTTTASGKLYWNIITAISQWERETIGERTKIVLQHKKKNGERVGTVPFGYCLSEEKCLVPIEREQIVLRKIKQYRKRNWSLRKIVNWLNRQSIKAKNGGKWWAGTVRSVLGERI